MVCLPITCVVFSSQILLSCDIKHSAWRKTLKKVVTSSTLQNNNYAASYFHGALAGEHADFSATVFSHDNMYEAIKWIIKTFCMVLRTFSNKSLSQ